MYLKYIQTTLNIKALATSTTFVCVILFEMICVAKF